jgi:DNA polymerase V
MRFQSSAANYITLYLRTSAFDTRTARYVADYTIQLPVPTEVTSELINFAIEALKKIYRPEKFYSTAGVLLSGLIPITNIQSNLKLKKLIYFMEVNK